MSNLATKQGEHYNMTDAEIVELVERHGIDYFHGNGCAVLKNGVWLQPQQQEVHLNHMIKECGMEVASYGH